MSLHHVFYGQLLHYHAKAIGYLASGCQMSRTCSKPATAWFRDSELVSDYCGVICMIWRGCQRIAYTSRNDPICSKYSVDRNFTHPARTRPIWSVQFCRTKSATHYYLPWPVMSKVTQEQSRIAWLKRELEIGNEYITSHQVSQAVFTDTKWATKITDFCHNEQLQAFPILHYLLKADRQQLPECQVKDEQWPRWKLPPVASNPSKIIFC